jgi:hypothetical protein
MASQTRDHQHEPFAAENEHCLKRVAKQDSNVRRQCNHTVIVPPPMPSAADNSMGVIQPQRAGRDRDVSVLPEGEDDGGDGGSSRVQENGLAHPHSTLTHAQTKTARKHFYVIRIMRRLLAGVIFPLTAPSPSQLGEDDIKAAKSESRIWREPPVCSVRNTPSTPPSPQAIRMWGRVLPKM